MIRELIEYWRCYRSVFLSFSKISEESVAQFQAYDRAFQQSVHTDAGESAASSEFINASAESSSKTETKPAQRG